MKTKTIYISDDGKAFETSKECEAYERKEKESHRELLNNIEAYDYRGYKLDLSERDWFPCAETIIVKTEEAARALVNLFSKEDEEYYEDTYQIDFARSIVRILNNFEEFKPMVFCYTEDSHCCADNPYNLYVKAGWYYLNELLYPFRFGIEFVLKTDPSFKIGD